MTSPEPWTSLRTWLDLLDAPTDEPAVRAARAEMLAHPQVLALVVRASTWGRSPLRRHNDASHPLHALSSHVPGPPAPS